MTSNDVGFTTNPWEEETLSYPSACRLFYPLNNKCYVSKGSSTGQLVFFVTTNGKFHIDLTKKYYGFSLELIINDDSTTHLLCTLNDIDLQDKFSVLAKSVAKDTCLLDGQLLFEKTVDIINSWSSFFKPERKGLSHEEYVGIWGELYFLNFELMPEISNPATAIDYWIGPLGKKENRAKQDFTFDDLAFEIKTSMSGSSKDIKISSKDQLDKITNELYLVNLYINQTESETALSLQELYDIIIDKLSSSEGSKIDFVKKANQFMSKASDKQLKQKIQFMDSIIYLVDNKFPALTHANIPEGIIDTKYIISSSSIRSFIVKKTIKEIIND